ncbi:hypothetical protein BDV28DRAFT_144956 [Aspergillus coremiiformis]|uniref:Myb-like DNA-binding domain-containing protein n=1 Tax=Aspergillus coremiiformis TaxID=138285 RepID=A0A5N6ZGA3_9EURO|nr:hypothetical protein BDV28DRAFT_144956 [Aspergillus coremiiformis]
MSRITDTEQLEFLLSCIRHSNNGKVDFEEVAKECDIVTKGAAAKRYERLVKCRSNASAGVSQPKSPVPSPKKAPKSSGAKRKATPKAASKIATPTKMKVIAVARAEKWVERWADLVKVEDRSSDEETEIDEDALGVSDDDDALLDRFCRADGRDGYVQVKGEHSDPDA